jgi:RNA polymerase sigma-70 factor (ECF subfamily)
MQPIHDLYERYAVDVYRFSLFLCGNRSDAEDITADTFVRVWTAPGDIHLETVKAYLFTIARHLYIDRCRATSRLARLDADLPFVGPSAEDRAEAQSEVAHVRDAIRRLPDDDRAALLMRASGVSYQEIARALRASAGAIKVRVHRARKRLLASRQSGVTPT